MSLAEEYARRYPWRPLPRRRKRIWGAGRVVESGSYIQTEAGDYLTTEAGDRLITE